MAISRQFSRKQISSTFFFGQLWILVSLNDIYFRDDGATVSFVLKENEVVKDFVSFYRADTEIKDEDGEIGKEKGDQK